MKNLSVNVGFIIVGALVLLFFVHECNTPIEKPPTNVVMNGVLNIAKDTIGRFALIDSLSKEKKRAAFWKMKFDSLLKKTPTQSVGTSPSLTEEVGAQVGEDTSVVSDDVFDEYFMPYQFPVENKTSISYVTVKPLEPRGTRVRIDSTIYKMDSVSVRVNITEADCAAYIPKWYEHWETKVVTGVLVLVAILK